MKKTTYCALVLSLFLCTQLSAQETSLFSKGEVSGTNNHTGTVWLKELNRSDSIIDCNIATATFAPGARLDWHIHPSGQVLLITDGVGYYQEKDKPGRIVRKGDVIKCLPGVAHWHGASPASSFTYIAVSTNAAKGKTIWLNRVTEEEYANIK